MKVDALFNDVQKLMRLSQASDQKSNSARCRAAGSVLDKRLDKVNQALRVFGCQRWGCVWRVGLLCQLPVDTSIMGMTVHPGVLQLADQTDDNNSWVLAESPWSP